MLALSLAARRRTRLVGLLCVSYGVGMLIAHTHFAAPQRVAPQVASPQPAAAAPAKKTKHRLAPRPSQPQQSAAAPTPAPSPRQEAQAGPIQYKQVYLEMDQPGAQRQPPPPPPQPPPAAQKPEGVRLNWHPGVPAEPTAPLPIYNQQAPIVFPPVNAQPNAEPRQTRRNKKDKEEPRR